jgi:hypothetical protein
VSDAVHAQITVLGAFPALADAVCEIRADGAPAPLAVMRGAVLAGAATSCPLPSLIAGA